MPETHQSLSLDISNLWGNHERSDLTIRCQGRDFPVHKLILEARTDYFKNCLKSHWDESSRQVLEYDEFEPEIIEALLQHVYGLEYKAPKDGDCFMDKAITMVDYLAHLYAAADFFQLHDLKKKVKLHFRSTAEHANIYAESVDSDLREITPEEYNMDLRSQTAQATFMASHAVYTPTPSTDRGLRDIVERVTVQYHEAIMRRPESKAILEEVPELANALVSALSFELRESDKLVRAWHRFLRDIAKFICSKCSKDFFVYNSPAMDRPGVHMTCPYCHEHGRVTLERQER